MHNFYIEIKIDYDIDIEFHIDIIIDNNNDIYFENVIAIYFENLYKKKKFFGVSSWTFKEYLYLVKYSV